MTYTDKDLELADSLWSFGVSKPIAPTRADVARLIATVRRETVEECAAQCELRDDTHRELAAGLIIAERRIRALLDEPKAEPKCRSCGLPENDDEHSENGDPPWTHVFDPEEPGHG